MAKQTFTTGQVLSATQMTSLQQTAMLGGAANAKTASYTLVAADAGDAITMSNASATTITVNSGLFSAGDIVTIINLGAGICTITAGTATVTTSGSLALAINQGGILRFTSASSAIFFQFAVPSASGSMTQLATGTLSGSSTVISGLSGSYKDLKVIINGYRGSSTGLNLQLRINNDSTANRHQASAFTYFGAGLTYNATFMNGLTDGCPATATNTLVKIDIPDYANTSTYKMVQWYSISNADSTTVGKLTGANGVYNQIGAVTGLTFLADGGTFAGGTYYVYGVN